MRILVNHTNHPSTNWHPAQKEGWDAIVDIAFPNIPPQWSEEELRKFAREKFLELRDVIRNYGAEVWVCLQGEYSYCYLMFDMLASMPSSNFRGFAIPTTERRVIEKDGQKISTFEFVRWRLLEIQKPNKEV